MPACGTSSCAQPLQAVEKESGQSSSEWKVSCEKMRVAEGISTSDKPKWSTDKVLGSVARGRSRDIIDLAFQVTQHKRQDLTVEQIQESLWVDISQSGSRRLWKLGGQMRSLTTSSTIFSFELRRASTYWVSSILGRPDGASAPVSGRRGHERAGNRLEPGSPLGRMASLPQAGAFLASWKAKSHRGVTV